MRKIWLAALMGLFVTVSANAQTATPTPAPTSGIKSVCKKVVSVTNGQFVYKNSAPLRSGGVGTPMIGYRQEPTLIMRRGWSRGMTTIYDSKGKSIGRCPWADAHGFSGGRWRCTMNTGGLRRTAVRNTRKPTVYFRLNSSTCAEVPDAGRCYGSVKGLCNRTIG